MLKRKTFVSLFLIIALSVALPGIPFSQVSEVLAQGTDEPVEEPEEPEEEETSEPEEEPAPTEVPPTPVPMQAAPTAAPAQEAAPAATAAPAQEAAPAAEATPATLPVTGMASNPLPIMWVVLGTVAGLGVLSGISLLRKRKTQE